MQAVKRQRHGIAQPSAWGVGWGDDYNIRQGLKYTLETGAQVIKADWLLAAPLMIPAGTRFDRAGVRVGITGSPVARMGLYASDPRTGGPGALVLDFGTVALVANSDCQITIDLTIHETGIYWLAVQEEEGTGFYSPRQRAGTLLRSAVSSNGVPAWGYSVIVGQAGGSLADPFPASAPAEAGPTIYMRVADAPPPRQRLKRVQSIGTPMGVPDDKCTLTGQMEAAAGAISRVVAADNLYACPMLIQEAVDISSIEFDVTTPGTGSAYVGLYDGGADGYPRDLLFGSGALSLASAAGKTAACSLHLPPGLYWAAIQTGGTGAATLNARYPDGFLGFATSLNGQFPHMELSVASSSAGMPATFPSGGVSARTAPSIILNGSSPVLSGQGLPHRTHVNVAMPVPYHIYHEGWYVAPSAFQWQAVSAKLAHGEYSTATSFVLDRETTFSGLWVNVKAVTGSGYNVEMGVYDDTGYHLPNRLLVTTGPQAKTTQTGLMSFSLEFTLSPGLYWLAVAIDLNVATSVDLGATRPLGYRLGWTGDLTVGAYVGQASLPALPDPWTGIETSGAGAPLAGMAVKHYGAA